MLFGGASSAVAIAAGKRAREHGLLYFGTLTYSNDTTGKDGQRYLFRECNSAWMSARVLGQYLAKTLPGKRYFYVTADYTWGTTSESSLRQASTIDFVVAGTDWPVTASRTSSRITSARLFSCRALIRA